MLKEEARAVLLKLERAYASPGGVVKMQTLSQQVWVGLGFSVSSSTQVKLMLANLWATREGLPVVPREELLDDSYPRHPPHTTPAPGFASNLPI